MSRRVVAMHQSVSRLALFVVDLGVVQAEVYLLPDRAILAVKLLRYRVQADCGAWTECVTLGRCLLRSQVLRDRACLVRHLERILRRVREFLALRYLVLETLRRDTELFRDVWYG